MDSPDRLLGTVIDNRYRLSDFIGHGAYGSVFAAEEVTLGQVITRVAVKLITPETEDQRRTVMKEIVGLARFNHDYIIAYRSSGQIAYGDMAGSLFLATELGDTNLAKVTKMGERLSDDQLRELVRGVASALAHLHTARGAIHGDVKPANIIRVKDRWKLGDLGLLRSTQYKPSGPLQGSLTYIAPEMLRHEFSPANDVYALGVTILNHFTGRYAHSADSRDEFIENLRTQPPYIPDALREPWKSLLVQCLQRNPAQRATAEQIEQFFRAHGTMFPAPTTMPVVASSVVVSPDGDGQFATIQQAVESVTPGTEIIVRPGKYRETIRIDKPLTIIGDGKPEQVVVSTRDERCLEVDTDHAVYVRGIMFRTRPGPNNVGCYAVDLGRGKVSLEDCYIRSATMPCLAVHEDATVTLKYCTVFGGQDAGVFVYDGGQVRLEDCLVTGHSKTGVSVGDGGRATFARCEVRANQSSGVFLSRGGEGTFEDCQIVGNAKAGVVVAAGGRGSFQRCRINDNGGEGVILQDGATGTVTNCDLTRNAKGPWRMSSACTLTRRGNTE